MGIETAAAAKGAVRVEKIEGGAFWLVTLASGKGNILDRNVVEALDAIAHEAKSAPDLKAILLQADGPHFSFGASVAEHLPGEVEGMLRRFHGLFRSMLESSVIWVAAVRGRCLGGGLELVSFCHRVFAHSECQLGQPEIVLGVFAPVASAFLHERIGRAAAEDLCFTGRSVAGSQAQTMRLVDELAIDPESAALAWAKTHLSNKSASSLRRAVTAARWGLEKRFLAELSDLELFYLRDLMKTADANEGLAAFLEKRSPVWKNR